MVSQPYFRAMNSCKAIAGKERRKQILKGNHNNFDVAVLCMSNHNRRTRDGMVKAG